MRTTALVRLVGSAVMRTGRRIDNRIVLVNQGVGGNLNAFRLHLEIKHPEVEVVRLYISRSDYRRAVELGDTAALDATRVRHLLRVAHARAIVTGAGPSSLRPWIAARNRPLFVDAWHGVGFKSRITSAGPSFRAYDAHFVSSEHVAAYYRNHGGVPSVTGYARMDDLLVDDGSLSSVARAEFPDAGSTARFVLVAPTWDIARAPEIDDRAILEALSRAAVEHDLVIAYRPHKYAAPVDIADLPRVRPFGSERFPRAEPLLAVTDVLVTDWSSIATDYLALDRPIVYLDAAPPVEALGPLDRSDRPGTVAATADELATAVTRAAVSTQDYLEEFGARMSRSRHRAWGDTLDGRSSARYLESIEALESARSR